MEKKCYEITLSSEVLVTDIDKFTSIVKALETYDKNEIIVEQSNNGKVRFMCEDVIIINEQNIIDIQELLQDDQTLMLQSISNNFVQLYSDAYIISKTECRYIDFLDILIDPEARKTVGRIIKLK